MADFTFTFGPKTRTFTTTASNSARIQSWCLFAYPTIPNPAYTGPGSGVSSTLPNPEPVLSAIDGLWQGIKDNVKNSEKATAINTIPPPGDIT